LEFNKKKPFWENRKAFFYARGAIAFNAVGEFNPLLPPPFFKSEKWGRYVLLPPKSEKHGYWGKAGIGVIGGWGRSLSPALAGGARVNAPNFRRVISQFDIQSNHA
jgi:hypothetical protein